MKHMTVADLQKEIASLTKKYPSLKNAKVILSKDPEGNAFRGMIAGKKSISLDEMADEGYGCFEQVGEVQKTIDQINAVILWPC